MGLQVGPDWGNFHFPRFKPTSLHNNLVREDFHYPSFYRGWNLRHREVRVYPKSHSPQVAAPGFKPSQPGPSTAIHSHTQTFWPIEMVFWNVCFICSPIKLTGLTGENKIWFQITLQKDVIFALWIFATHCFADMASSPWDRSPLDTRKSAFTAARHRLRYSKKHSPGLGSELGFSTLMFRTDSKTVWRNSLGEQSPSHLGSCLLQDVRKLYGAEKMADEERIIIKAH